MNDLSAVREVWATRTTARRRADLLYLLYLVAMTLLVLGIPGLLSAGQLLARPDVLPALTSPHAPRAITAACFAAAALALQAGSVRGPALMAPFFIDTLASSGLRRRAVLRRPFVRALLVPVIALVVLSALAGTTLIAAGGAEPAGAVLFAVAAAGTGLLLGAAWLAGQLLERVGVRLLYSALLLGGAAVSAVLPVGIGLGAVHPRAPGPAPSSAPLSSAPLLWTLALASLGVLATTAGMLLLDRLRGRVLREQAARWESASTLATSGDLAGASGRFRPPPSGGRRLPAVGPRPLVLLYARRDAVAWLRSPERLAAGVLAGLVGAALLTGSTLLGGPLAWGSVLLGSALLWAASSAVVDGIRHGIHTLGSPSLLGQTAPTQVLLHSPAPMLLMAVIAALGGSATLLLAGAAPDASALLLPVLLSVVLIAGRARDAAKGPMPLSLMTPMPTAQGDLSVLSVVAWQADALLLALLAGVVLAALAVPGTGAMLLGAAPLLGAMVLMTLVRLRALRG